MRLIGYSNPMMARPGEKIALHVSCAEASFRASIVRLQHGDTNPKGPGFKAKSMPSAIDGRYDGAPHAVPAGSYAIVDDADTLLNAPEVTIAIWVWPTAPGRGRQSILARGDGGFWLGLDDAGRPSVNIGSQSFQSADALLPRQWYLLVVQIDRKRGKLELHALPAVCWPGKVKANHASTMISPIATWDGPLMMAARLNAGRATDHFNGKLDSPQIFSQWLTPSAIDELLNGESENSVVAGSVHWDFGADQSSLIVPDDTGRYSARLIGMPTRAVTGRCWNGNAEKPSDQPRHYSAIHFHDDDRDDAGWPESFCLTVDPTWPSGIYAVWLQTDAGDEDYVPFFVQPSRHGPFAPLAFLAPTFSYLAYGNTHHTNAADVASDPTHLVGYVPAQIQDGYVLQEKLNSCYDHHSDGSGVCYVSRLLPQVHIRPKINFNGFDGPHQLNADLHLIDWLTVKGFAHDVLTDELLHHEGLSALKPYRAILTGTHPEYWSGAMLDALQTYLNDGGRVMYLGGNGFYWVTSVHPHAPHVLEIRKAHGTHTWSARPGEHYHASSGERGGLWRHRGRAPQKMLGVGMAGEGFPDNAAYRRTPESYAESVAFMFEGITEEVFGDTPSLVQSWGAAGFEVDRVDFALGSPPNTISVAQSLRLGDNYLLATEDILASMLTNIGPDNPKMRSDIAFIEYPNGGAVFSVGSVAYCACLSFNNYDNGISRLTENVLRRFLEDGTAAVS